MKLLCCLLFTFCITFKSHSQNCKTLDNKLFFTSIKFGDQLSNDLMVCLKKTKTEYSYYTGYRIKYDSLNQDYKKKYADLFTFLSVPFSFSQITANKKEQIYSVELYSFFNDYRNDSMAYNLPANFTGIAILKRKKNYMIRL
jgi:hypothetical protein